MSIISKETIEYVTREDLFKGFVFINDTSQLDENWINLPIVIPKNESGTGEQITFQPRLGLERFLQYSMDTATKLYNEVLLLEQGLTFDNASVFLVNALGDYLQYISILENTYIQANVVQSLQIAYSYAGSCGCIVRLANFIFGEDLGIEFYLEETPKRIVFRNIYTTENRLLGVGSNNEVLGTPDGEALLIPNIRVFNETIPVLEAFFSKFVMANYATVFEFIV